jgi:hypothetical protein
MTLFICCYCGSQRKNLNSWRNHERCCPSNPDRNYKNGMIGEVEVLPRIKEYFKRDIKATTYKYDTYDFYDNEYKYELNQKN